MKKFQWMTILVLAGLLLSACQRTADVIPESSPIPQNNPVAEDSVFTPSSDPVNITVSLDAAQSAEALIPVEGGTLSVTGADGTTYTLSIPPDALLSETTIRMLPVDSIAGMPFGSEAHAVQLYPEGLFFNNFVTLTITPSVPIPVDQQIMFGYLGDGQDLVLAPPVMDSSEIKIQLLHFSGYGVSKGLLADIEPVRNRIGGDAERRLQSQVAEVLGKERQNQLLNGQSDLDLGEYFTEIFAQFEEQVIKPRLAAAGESCAAGRLALQTVLGLERQRQLLGMGGETGFMENYPGLMDTVTSVCLKEEYQMCANDHIIHRMIPVWLGLERQYQLLGMDPAKSSPVLEEARKLVTKCLTFDLVFESNANFDDGGGGGYTSIVKSKVKLRFDPAGITLKGSSALINESFNFSAEGCSVDSVRGGGTFDAQNLAYKVDTSSPNDPIGHVTDFTLYYFPGVTSESFTIQCEDQPAYTTPPGGYWSGVYLVLHQAELDQSVSADAGQPAVPDISGLMAGGEGTFAMGMPQTMSGGAFVVTEWEILGGEYFAKKEWIKADSEGLGLTEAGTFKLYHRPGQ